MLLLLTAAVPSRELRAPRGRTRVREVWQRLKYIWNERVVILLLPIY